MPWAPGTSSVNPSPLNQISPYLGPRASFPLHYPSPLSTSLPASPCLHFNFPKPPPPYNSKPQEERILLPTCSVPPFGPISWSVGGRSETPGRLEYSPSLLPTPNSHPSLPRFFSLPRTPIPVLILAPLKALQGL